MGRLSLGQVRVLLIIAGILVLVLTFFCIVQPNFNRAQSYDTKTEQANAEIKELQEMDATNADLESFTSLYMEGYDVRFQTAQAIPVFINEILVRLIYSVRRMIRYYSMINKEERSFKRMLKECEPFSNARSFPDCSADRRR